MDSSSPRQYRVEILEEGRGMRKFVLQKWVESRVESEGVDNRTTSSAPWRTLSFVEVADLWQDSPAFVETFAESLASVPFEAFFWESVPVTKSTLVSVGDGLDPPFRTAGSTRCSGYSSSGLGSIGLLKYRHHQGRLHLQHSLRRIFTQHDHHDLYERTAAMQHEHSVQVPFSLLPQYPPQNHTISCATIASLRGPNFEPPAT